MKTITDSCLHCGRTVSTPLRLTNLTHKPKEEYYACPFCFSRLEADEVPDHLECVHGHQAVAKTSSIAATHQKNEKNPEKTEIQKASCPHSYGYLNNRPKDTVIPDECLTCNRILQCMTKSL